MSMDSKVPEVRFKGFSGEWDEEILGELVKLENGFAFQSKYFKKTPTEVIVLTPGSVNIGGGFQAGKGQYYDEKQEVSSKYVFKPGDMFITMTDLTPTAQALGFPAIIPKDENTYLHNQRLGKLVGFNGDLAFLYSLLCTMKKQKEVVSTSSGTTVKHTSPDKFLNRICLFPNKEEQTQIGNYFQKLDSLINQHQQKHDKLSNIKKAMLEKMFPKQGEVIPEIRFKGFSGAWEEKALNRIAEKITDKNISILYCETFTNSAEFGIISQRDYFDKDISNSNNISGYYVVQPDNFVYNPRISTLAPCGPINRNTLERVGIMSPLYTVFKIKGVNAIFIEYFFQTKLWHNFMFLNGDTGARADRFSIKDSVFFELPLLVPTVDEQTAIGNYFQKLDALINQHQQQITKLNNIKQACLSKMFI
ncbi:restriction endonuclease subunit S [Yersinia massiliensis]|uniref:Restriction endonuclease subunit S n=1 Tax=Yersinia massiliensis TaxID=419257 RepID=A0AA91BI58_9GAMM|nr:restriction endonuclease subunit S [Yersinia massiliensis]NIL26916.1 restriction endonuclease subunit S [Yersinia massiliensis]